MDGRRLLHGADGGGVAPPAAEKATTAGQRAWCRGSGHSVRRNRGCAAGVPQLGADRVFDRWILDARAARGRSTRRATAKNGIECNPNIPSEEVFTTPHALRVEGYVRSTKVARMAAAWCDFHHVVHWLYGGPTSCENGALLCERHHTAVHEGRFSIA